MSRKREHFIPAVVFCLILSLIGGFTYIAPHTAGNKVKGQISKRLFQANKATQLFRKTNISYPLIRPRTVPYDNP